MTVIQLLISREFDFPLYWDPMLVPALFQIVCEEESRLQQLKLSYSDLKEKFLVFLKGTHKASQPSQ